MSIFSLNFPGGNGFGESLQFMGDVNALMNAYTVYITSNSSFDAETLACIEFCEYIISNIDFSYLAFWLCVLHLL